VGSDSCSLGFGVAGGGEQRSRLAEVVADGVGVAAGARERRQLRLCAQSPGVEPDADLGPPAGARPCQAVANGFVALRVSVIAHVGAPR